MPDTASPPVTIPGTIPFVDYLVLDDGEPHLLAQECTSCGARFFDRRNACAGCFGTEFRTAKLATEGELRSFTIVAFAAPGVEVPFTAGLVDLGGTSARGNIINCPPDPEHVKLGMRVRLATYSTGFDEAGTEAINFGFEPTDQQNGSAS
ncbi:MAG TPA: OB-fold domain-containing protein [Ilumatobacter sp.]|nr:OB-fold domain-containing protein [Ilumatobacter sp.]